MRRICAWGFLLFSMFTDHSSILPRLRLETTDEPCGDQFSLLLQYLTNQLAHRSAPIRAFDGLVRNPLRCFFKLFQNTTRCPNDFLSPGDFVSRVAPALLVP
jgi:hypothetical protein